MPQDATDPALTAAEVRQLIAEFPKLRLRDRETLKRQISKIEELTKTGRPAGQLVAGFKRMAERALQRSLVEAADALRIEYPKELPVSRRKDDIIAALRDHQVVIVCGATGSGKTTQLPKVMLEMGRGRHGVIGCTQPRRLAANAMARRLAAELGCEFGSEVGCKVRFDDRTGPHTVVKFMTDGMLLAETGDDRSLLEYDTIIIDEVHERSLNIDFLLGYLKQLLLKRRDLKLVISSATLDTERFSEFFDRAPVIAVEGRTYPVEDLFLPPEDDEDLSSHIGRAVEFLDEFDPSGDILVFLPGEREIRDACDLLSGRRFRNTEVLPLFARLSLADQQKIFSPGRCRRIILATNVAETSVTIPRIHYVIDSGLARISRYNPRSGVQELQIERISQSSFRQRRGRCGRLSDGVCVSLCDSDTLEAAPEYTDPEIRRTSLAGVILQMAMLRLGKIEKFPFVDPPPAQLIREGRQTLADIGAIDASGHITQSGWRIAALPVDPHFGRMLAAAEELGILPEMTVLVAFMSIQDPRERPRENPQAADQIHNRWRNPESDFLTVLNMWNFLMENATSRTSLRKLARKSYMNGNRVAEWANLVDDLRETLEDEQWKTPRQWPRLLENPPGETIHRAVLSGVPRNIAMYDPERANYLGTGGRRFLLFPGSALARQKTAPRWIVTLALVETTRVFARMNAAIRPELLELSAPHMCSAVYDQPAFDPTSGFVYAREKLVSGGLVIHPGRRVHYGKMRPAEARRIFIREALCEGLISSRHPQIKAHLRELDALSKLEAKLRRPGTVIDPEAIFDELTLKLPLTAVSTKDLEEYLNGAKLFPLSREISMQAQYTPIDFSEYPDSIEFSGEKYPAVYTFDPDSPADGLSVPVPSGELNLIPPARLDYLIPGYLREKVEIMLRKLPKQLRVALSPQAETLEAFMDACKSGRIAAELPLAETLADFLTDRCNANFSARDFANIEFPEYLYMKIGVTDRAGKVVEYRRELDDVPGAGSAVSGRLARRFSLPGGNEWPGGDLPESLQLPDNPELTAYPALRIDPAGGVGRELYLRPDEAAMRHRAGVIELFKLRNADQLRFVAKNVKFSNSSRLGIFYNDVGRLYKEDFKNLLVERALGGGLWGIRGPEAFLLAADKAKMSLGETSDNLLAEIELYAGWHEKISAGIDRVGGRAAVCTADAERQLGFLFRPGFLRSDEALSGYLRYLRGLSLRLERMNSAPAKDEAKLEPLAGLLDRFHLAAAGVDDIANRPPLLDFFLLLEELRLAVFAPEVRPKRKITLAIALEAWKDLRF
ncbi:MAG: ATP-dependent RNA helicase HrpA [Victivallaceae bacterium]